MKKLSIMLCLVTIVFTVSAQKPKEDDNKKKKTDCGFNIFGGLNYSNFSGDNSSDNQYLFGGHGGVGIKLMNISGSMDLRSELIYSQQGDRTSYGSSSYGGKSTERLSYLNLPVLAHYQNKSGFFAEAGLQPGLLLSAKQKSSSDYGGSGGSSSSSTDIKKDLNSFDLGIPVGAGFKFKNKFAVSARFTPGLLNVDKKDGAFDGNNERNAVFSARVSYMIK